MAERVQGTRCLGGLEVEMGIFYGEQRRILRECLAQRVICANSTNSELGCVNILLMY